MKKSTIIATCLVNSSMICSLEDAEYAVQKIFKEEFLALSLEVWNADFPENVAKHIITGQ